MSDSNLQKIKKKLLIISYSYPPSNAPAAQRPYTLAKYLNKDIFDVTIITCGNLDSTLGFDKGFNAELPDIKLIKVDSLIGSKTGSLRKRKSIKKNGWSNRIKSSMFSLMSSLVVPDKAIFWYPKVRKYLLENPTLIYDSNIVFTTSPAFSNHLVGKFVKSRNKSISWISELRDFHFLETTKNVRNLKHYINSKLEDKVIMYSDKVSFISHSMQDLYLKRYPSLRAKSKVIYNGLDVSDFENLYIGRTENKKMTIFYAGSFYRGVRSPVPLLMILDQLIKEGTISLDQIEIIIAGNLEDEIVLNLKKFISYGSLKLIGNIPRTEVLKNLVSADLLWLIVGHKSTHYAGVPIKFFEYLGARRPIINFAPKDSEPTRIISKYKLGWNFDTSNFDLDICVKSFEQIIAVYRDGVLHESLPKRNYPEFDREHQSYSFEKLFIDPL